VSGIKLFLVIAALMVLGSLSVRADEATTQPTTQESSAAARIPARYKSLDLTDEQKSQIGDIHQKASGQIRDIDKQEQTDIDALLTDDQKAQLKKIDDDRKAEAKARRAEKRSKQGETATTENRIESPASR
jgi:Spy/CpxP family protein refolding chaperone